jgi:UDP-xylose/UDP-N-acetylglucosamine transporter B4
VTLVASFIPLLHGTLNDILSRIQSQVACLLLNGLTQYLCIRGMYLLTARSSHLTVTMVLSIRKLVSLVLSIWLFWNSLSLESLFDAIIVFVGGALYGFENA